ncbi:saccharopine dehydrogenase NADP-binding domain-containing protein [Nocardia sp. BSTN01]|uniref:saccharopine dehydrogenase family protein n=1 Tax=Nocardia sp. BSTN01 TaxID=2783665 RepID=UPI00188EB6A9|nr:saccharopine dehydrogenase NADP-binding domain-containing protein [Nocardia sp. BSTN01]MBF5001907.1 saccharopine dehydrogenase NADP-binding domain-containing protein [Nocardia sp. BSTN01]
MPITVYGANGYQAKLVLAELSRLDVEVRLVGRNAERLENTATELGISHVDRRVAALDDHATLVSALTGSEAVINCAGPFTTSGAAVVRAAIDAGVGYVDTSGEQLYVKSIFDTFADDAKRAGVTVVPSTNDGCVPLDLLARLIAEQTGPLAEITVSHIINGGAGPSRGSLRSALATIDALAGGGLTYEDGSWRTGIPARHSTITLPAGQSIKMAKIPLNEVVTIPRHVQVDHVESLVEAELQARLSMPITAELIESLPLGPAEQDRSGQEFTYLLDALDSEGRHTRGIIRGADTYGTTAVIAVEAARRIATGGTEPGVLTPAQAFDAADFLAFLSDHRLSWAIEAAE